MGTRASARIYALAAKHGNLAERFPIDDWADKATELPGDEVVSDSVEDLGVTLQRMGVITDEEAARPYWEDAMGGAAPMRLINPLPFVHFPQYIVLDYNYICALGGFFQTVVQVFQPSDAHVLNCVVGRIHI